MAKKALITGDAGFIGSHLADEQLEHGYEVRAFDNLAPQVHGPRGEKLSYLYGEGLCHAADGTLVSGVERSPAQLQSHDWELRGVNGEILAPIPTPETNPQRSPQPTPNSRLAALPYDKS